MSPIEPAADASPPPPRATQIWVDADACPGAVREILFRAVQRTGVQMTLVANKPLRIPPIPGVLSLQVSAGFDAADKRIVELMGTGDLVVTADVPLAAAVIEKGGTALNPRGELYTRENVRERLSVRNFLDELRGSGVNTGGPAALGQREKAAFANQLDRWLARRARS
jgi:uncharacterized protein YaiI (UPF0178 family)